MRTEARDRGRCSTHGRLGNHSRDLGKQGRGRGPVPRDAAGQINPAGVLFHNPRGRSLDLNPRADRFAGEAPVRQSRMRAREGPASCEFMAPRRHHGDPMLARRLRHGLAPAGEIRDLGVDLLPVRVPRQQDRMDVHVTFVVMAPQKVAVAGELPAHHGRDRGGEARSISAGPGRTDDVEHIARLPAVEIPRHGLGERAFRLGAGVHRPALPRREPVPPSAGHGAQLGLHALQRMAGGDEAEPHESRAGVLSEAASVCSTRPSVLASGLIQRPFPVRMTATCAVSCPDPRGSTASARARPANASTSASLSRSGATVPAGTVISKRRASRDRVRLSKLSSQAASTASRAAAPNTNCPRSSHTGTSCRSALPLSGFRLALAGADVRHQSPAPARPAGPAHDLHDSGLGAERDDGRSARSGPRRFGLIMSHVRTVGMGHVRQRCDGPAARRPAP